MPTPLYNSKTGITATPTSATTSAQESAAIAQGFTPITPSMLAPVTPIQVPTSNVSTPSPYYQIQPPVGTTVGADGTATTPSPTATPQLEQNTSSWLKEQFKKLGDTLGTKSATTQQLQSENQLSQKTLQATTDYNAYVQEKLKLQQEIQNIQSKGGSSLGVDRQVQDLTRRGNANLANLALQAQVSQGLLSAAQQTIKDKLDAQFSPIQDQIDYLTKFAQINNNDLTESEKFKLKEKADQKKSDLVAVRKISNDLHQEVLDNGNPPGVLAALDKVTNDFTAGRIDANEAQNQMFAVAGRAPKIGKTDAINTQVLDLGNRKVLINSKTGEIIKDFSESTADEKNKPVALAQAQGNISLISDLANNNAIRSAVGPSILGRLVGRGLDTATGQRQDFIAGVEQLTSQLSLDSLIRAKQNGATFGALSEGELSLLSGSASKINSWAIKDKQGKITGYNTSEKAFKKELDKINNFAKLDYINRGGDAESVGVKLMNDGSYWTQNSDGTYTKLK